MLKSPSISCSSLQKSNDSQQTKDRFSSGSTHSQKKSVLLILNSSSLVEGHMEVQSKIILPNNAEDTRIPILIECPVCRQKSETLISYQYGSCTYLMAFILSFLCFLLAFIPFYKNECQDVIQHCSRCAAIVGQSKYYPCVK